MSQADTAKALREKIEQMAKAAGRKLTAAEKEMIASLGEEPEEDPRWAKTMVDLADACGVDRKTIQRKLKAYGTKPKFDVGYPGRRANGEYDVEAWKVFLGKETTDHPEEEDEEPAGKEKTPVSKQDWEIEKLKEIVRGLKFAQEVREGKFSLNDDVIRWESETMMQVRTVLLGIPNKLAAVIEHRPKDECEDLLKKAVDEALLIIHQRKWEEAHPTPGA